MRTKVAALVPCLLLLVACGAFADPRVETPETWFDGGQQFVQEAKQLQPNTNRARNIILFLGDGMGISTITAARILDGQLHGGYGEENSLSFEKLPYSALSKTYSVNQQTPDSAPTMTAIVTGVKTKDAMLSVNQNAMRADYRSVRGNELPTILEILKQHGKSVGVVTTTRITHATPAACYAHTSERDWECDGDLNEEARLAGFPDIARQMIEFKVSGGIDVMLGGGRAKFLPKTKGGARLDGRDLIVEWEAKTHGTYVKDEKELEAVSSDKATQLLGLFNPSHMEFNYDRTNKNSGEPSLTEMTSKAIEVLSKNTNGFFLMVEGGRIDHGHHQGNAFRALTETIEFSHAVEAALKKTDSRETLIIVTADHSHTLTISGYPKRGNNILGTVVAPDVPEESMLEKPNDGMGAPYTTLNYANGPGYVGASDRQAEGSKQFPHEPEHFAGYSSKRPALDPAQTTNPDYLQETIFPREMETHSGEDVAIFAGGPSSYLFHGVVEENIIFHVMLDAARISPSEIKRPQVFRKTEVTVSRK